jgi:hypothetical protein
MSPTASSSALAADTPALADRSRVQERLPIPQAALVIVSLSLALWAGIGFGVHWILG